MKAVLCCLIAAFLASVALATDYELIDDSPDGFLHFRALYENGEGAKDSFVNPRHVISVHVITSGPEDNQKSVVAVITTRIRPAVVGSESAGSTNWTYELPFSDRPAAEAEAKKIMALIAGRAEQLGAAAASEPFEGVGKLQENAPEEIVIEITDVKSTEIASASTSPTLKFTRAVTYGVTAKVISVTRTTVDLDTGNVINIHYTSTDSDEAPGKREFREALKKGQSYRAFLAPNHSEAPPINFVPAASIGSFQPELDAKH